MLQHLNGLDLIVFILFAWAFVHLGYEIGVQKTNLRIKHISEVKSGNKL